MRRPQAPKLGNAYAEVTPPYAGNFQKCSRHFCRGFDKVSGSAGPEASPDAGAVEVTRSLQRGDRCGTPPRWGPIAHPPLHYAPSKALRGRYKPVKAHRFFSPSKPWPSLASLTATLTLGMCRVPRSSARAGQQATQTTWCLHGAYT